MTRRFAASLLLGVPLLLFGGIKANAQLIIDDFVNSTLLTNPPGLSASSTIVGAGTFTDLRQIQDTATVLGGKRTLISAWAAGSAAGGSFSTSFLEGVAGGKWQDSSTRSMSGPVQLAGHRLLAYGATGMFGQANATTAPTGQVGVLVSSAPVTLFDASTSSGIRLVFSSVSAASVGAPFRVSLRDVFGHVMDQTIMLSSSGAQNVDFNYSSMLAPSGPSTFGLSVAGVFSMSQVSAVAVDYMPTAVSNFDIKLDRIQTFTTVSTVPEGSSIALLTAGMFGIGFGIRRRSKQ